MGTISEKLIYLNDTKIALMEALQYMGVSIPSNATFRELAELVYNIATTGDGTDLQDITVDENGTYSADVPYYGINQVTVNIPDPVLETLTAEENGLYEPTDGIDGFDIVLVDVPDPVLVTLNTTDNGTFTPDEGVDGFDEVIVNVSSDPVLESLTATENGVYTPSNGFEGFSSAVVAVDTGSSNVFPLLATLVHACNCYIDIDICSV